MPVNMYKMKPMKQILTAMCVCLITQTSLADSPLTSTSFYKAYESETIVQEALTNKLSRKVIQYLNGDHPIDVKIAAINAISWGNKEVVKAYEMSLKAEYKSLPKAYFDTLKTYFSQAGFLENAGNTPSQLSDDQLICWAYLQGMGDYFAPEKALGAAAIARSRNNKNQTYGMITGLLIAQIQLNTNWCGVYEAMNDLVLVPDYSEGLMKQEAIDIVFRYINLYKSSCDEEDEPVVEESFEVGAEVIVDDRDLIGINDGEIYVPEGLLKKQIIEKGSRPDLKIQETLSVEYDSDIKGTKVGVVVVNSGKVASLPCVALLENNQFDSIEMGDKIVYYKSAATLIPALEPGEMTTIYLKIPDYWVYDPNCEIRVTLDALNHIPEKNENNNVEEYAEYG